MPRFLAGTRASRARSHVSARAARAPRAYPMLVERAQTKDNTGTRDDIMLQLGERIAGSAKDWMLSSVLGRIRN